MTEKLTEDFNKNVIIQSVIKEYKGSEFTNNKQIGEGAFAAVYKAFHKELGYVAIKQIYLKSSVRVSNSATELEQELLEAAIMIRHSYHPNIVRVYGLLIPDKKYFSDKYIGYIMELMEHGSLCRIIHDKEKKYSMKQVFSWMRQAALGVLYLHNSKIIHRDIKPANFLIGNNLDNLKISDFGLAKPITKDTTITRGVGTYAYMSPELIDSQRYSYPSDIYALTISFWEMANRRRPYGHLDMSEFRIVGKILNDNERPQIQAETPLNSLLQRGWHKEPSLRPAVEEFRDFAHKAFEEADDSQTADEKAIDYTLQVREELRLHTSVCSELNLYVSVILLGGCWTDSICLYNSKEKKWINSPLKLPGALIYNGSVILNNEIYIFGGSNDPKSTYKLGENREWIKLADMNMARYRFGSLVFDDEIWVFGGLDEDIPLKTVEKYNPQTNSWTFMPQMDQAKIYFAVSIINGKFYVSGGYGDGNYLDKIEVFDPKKNKWEFFCNLPFGLNDHTSTVDGTNLIIIGGDKSDGEKSNIEISNEVWKIDVLDPKKEWKMMPNLQQKRFAHNAVKLVDGLMIIGGFGTDSVEIFDGQKWKEGPKLPEERSRFSSIPLTSRNEKKFLQLLCDVNKCRMM